MPQQESAALAAAGQGEDAAKLDDKERTRLRKQALDWLRADLALRRKQPPPRPADRSDRVPRSRSPEWRQTQTDARESGNTIGTTPMLHSQFVTFNANVESPILLVGLNRDHAWENDRNPPSINEKQLSTIDGGELSMFQYGARRFELPTSH